jgi:hypothetical protein
MGDALGALAGGGGASKRLAQLLRNHGAYELAWSLDAKQMKSALRTGQTVCRYMGHHSWGGFHQVVVWHQDVELLDMYVEHMGDHLIRTLAWRDAFATNPAFIDRLIAHGLNPNQTDWLGRTVLHWCAEKGDATTGAECVRHGADVNALDIRNRTTPLGYAARHGHTEMIRFLLEHGADPRLPNDRPWAQPLAYAEFEQQAEAARFLAGAAGKG